MGGRGGREGREGWGEGGKRSKEKGNGEREREKGWLERGKRKREKGWRGWNKRGVVIVYKRETCISEHKVYRGKQEKEEE